MNRNQLLRDLAYGPGIGLTEDLDHLVFGELALFMASDPRCREPSSQETSGTKGLGPASAAAWKAALARLGDCMTVVSIACACLLAIQLDAGVSLCEVPNDSTPEC